MPSEESEHESRLCFMICMFLLMYVFFVIKAYHISYKVFVGRNQQSFCACACTCSLCISCICSCISSIIILVWLLLRASGFMSYLNIINFLLFQIKAHPVYSNKGKAKDPIFGLTMGAGSQCSDDVFRWISVLCGLADYQLIWSCTQETYKPGILVF